MTRQCPRCREATSPTPRRSTVSQTICGPRMTGGVWGASWGSWRLGNPSSTAPRRSRSWQTRRPWRPCCRISKRSTMGCTRPSSIDCVPAITKSGCRLLLFAVRSEPSAGSPLRATTRMAPPPRPRWRKASPAASTAYCTGSKAKPQSVPFNVPSPSPNHFVVPQRRPLSIDGGATSLSRPLLLFLLFFLPSPVFSAPVSRRHCRRRCIGPILFRWPPIIALT
jgi:hypothetical protein